MLEQDPKGGTLGPFETVQLIVAKATDGTIPRVIGLTLEQARLKLARRELAGQVSALVAGDPGIVISQEPAGGLAAAPNMTVKLVIGR